jgi:alanyl-tRNA synthetase
MMTSSEIRQKFLDFFRSKQHLIVDSAPIVVKNDPTLMFTNAGMNQFKDYFLGNKEAISPRIADTQKCLRVSGKHNDLEDVGHDTYHHTMFEMLGNWSFGNYFKEEAIEWAFELLTKEYKLPIDRMYASVFEGDAKENLAFDQEAWDIWKKYLPEAQILKGNKKDNFWEMGDTGPCGPCSEIHIDLRPQAEIDAKSGKELVNNDHPQVIEIWNNVFIQFNRKADGSLESLPAKHVDTGMGFERLVRAIQGKTSNYDTDVFTPTIRFIENFSGKKYGQEEKIDVAMRVLADHVRAVAFAIADGQLPSNNKAGYVIRRILRRAVRYAFTFLDIKEPFVYKLVALLAEQFKGVFNELYLQKDFVARVVQEEEISFLRTLENGLKRFEQLSKSSELLESSVVDGKTVFELYDTYGFPVDLTALIAREKGLVIDEKGFEAEMNIQKDRSRKDANVETGDWVLVNDDDTVFFGYDTLSTTAQIVKYRQVKEKGKELYQIVLDNTPFYAESGGQVGDTGYIEAEEKRFAVLDTKKENDLLYILTDKLPEKTDLLFSCVVDKTKRQLTTSNHSATHLLQAALRQVLGNHVQQKGSLVNEDILRFDFAHFAKLTDEEIAQVEAVVNEKIRQAIPLQEERSIPIQAALKKGATALFGEKYGDSVRVITFGADYSVELCGGTHVDNTSKIGLFKIVSESSVAAGVRRIEAVTSTGAFNFLNEKKTTLDLISETLKSPKDLVKAVQDLLEEKVKLAKQLEEYEAENLNKVREQLFGKVQEKNGLHFLAEMVTVSNADALKSLAFQLRTKYPENLFCVLGSVINEKPQLAVMLSDNLVSDKGLNASNIVRELAKQIEGGGGGQPFFATAGGKKAENLGNSIKLAESFA